MPISLKVIKGKTRSIKPLVYDGEELNVEFYPNIFTPEMEEEQEKVRSGQSAGQMIKTMLIPLISSWDIMDVYPKLDANGIPMVEKDGTPITELRTVPLTEEGIGSIPMRILMDIVKAVGNDVTPGEEPSTNSEGTFSRAGV